MSDTTVVSRPPLHPVSQQPMVSIADGFATAREIATALAVAADVERRQPADVSTTRDFTGFSFEMAIAGNAILSQLAADICTAAGVENRLGDSFRFRRYDAGHWHPRHCDAYAIDGWHLVATAIVYLNDASGGETAFPDAAGGPLTIVPKTGRLAVWRNYLADGQVDQRSSHEAWAVRAGHKSTIANFIYNARPVAGRTG